MAMLALAFLAVLRRAANKGAPTLWTTSGHPGRNTGEPTPTTTSRQPACPATTPPAHHLVHR
ncbi:MAG: hypothetical protein JWN00_5971 [Actinomycetia bacterium]|nr:hypothetical protein [Actinomycetes bacterium]